MSPGRILRKEKETSLGEGKAKGGELIERQELACSLEKEFKVGIFILVGKEEKKSKEK